MPTTIVGSAGGGSAAWAELEADTYNAVIDGFEDAGVSIYDPDKEQFKFRYRLDLKDDEGEPITLHQWVNKVLSPKSNLAAIAAAAGCAWTPGQPFDLDTLVGRPVRLMVNVRETEKGPRPFIAEVIPPKKGAVVAAAPSATNGNVHEVTEEETRCSLPKCDGVVFKFDIDGNGFCEKHEKMAG